ncbi:methyltransferase domain-containing protein [Pontibacter sp. BT310]|uniref:Methyltransferase domain-containing protein n=1 Tax=Pontibacter populi TaxID=890055 RepID=A0ABS6XHW6_9BACT|nr:MULTISPECIES: methyltransferase domain-containing protein [Pontibacter]MBJ6119947.1 methyltransferase domain-containing protein [Pontibacter sp. BT310]MBR0572376.1 methyltransferase domain-containing protein [Microvirga sp. STS03]MBW3366800.1 methyltransferase domain-containing protein [Pontibacter populi]
MLALRSNQPELMDDLTLAGEELSKNLRELEIINNWLGGHKVVLDALDKLTANYKNQTITIADIGCGGGDTLTTIAKWANRKNIAVQLTGIDANDFMVTYARQHCQNYSNITIAQHDVFSSAFARQQYDIIVCSLFCHHFTDEQLVQLFRQLYSQARTAVIVNDLHRHWFAYYSIKYITKLFSGSRLVQNDAPLSVWRAFKRSELQQLMAQAGITNYSLRWMWAFRWQLVLNKPNPETQV